MHELARLCKLFPERGELRRMRRCCVRRPNEVADRRLRELGYPTESRERRRCDPTLPARNRDRLDSELLRKLFLGQASATPRSAQPTPHSAGLVGAQGTLLIAESAAGCVAIG